MLHLKKIVLALGVAALPALAAAPSHAQSDVASFYKGKTVTVVVGSTPGGGYDLYGRLVARHIGRYIPGNPNVIVSNMAGAASVVALKYILDVAAKDGTFIGAVYPGAIMEPLLGNGKVKFDAANLNYLGSANIDTFVCIMRADAPVKTFEDALKTQATLAATADGGTTVDFPTIETNLLGAKWKIVRGYPGSREINLAIEQGEVNGTCGMGWSSIQLQNPDWVTNGKFRLLAQETTKGHAVLNGMNVPLTYGFAKTESDRAILDFAYSQELFGRPFVVPSGVPAERVAALRQAFAAVLKDPDLLADAKKQRLEINALSGEEVQLLVAKIYAMPPDIIAKAKDAWVYKGK